MLTLLMMQNLIMITELARQGDSFMFTPKEDLDATSARAREVVFVKLVVDVVAGQFQTV
jgi:hypothetical protein